jgi:hypothetical protein
MSSRLCDVCETQQGSTHYVPARRRFECDDCENAWRPSKIDQAAQAAWESYSRENGHRMPWSDLHETSQDMWRDLARAVVNAYNA